ncbi:MAG: DUF5667 domain-containing protein [Candidatus Methanoperedens sp.]|nr:DUF5667 domain-containing protein [Candidatus Methanoperedens sp.]
MRLGNITLAGIILLVLVFTIGMAGAAENATGNETATGTLTETLTVTGTATSTATEGAADDEESGEGLIGPGNALYGLQIAFENIGETFTFNASEKLGKQVAHARKRIAEARAALKRNDTEAANKALEHYREKMEEANKSVSDFKGTDSGLANAEQMIAKHETVLKNLLDSHPGNKGLERAYNNSHELKGKFEEKIKRKEARKDGGNETKEAVNIKAKIIGNDTVVEVELKFKSGNIDNFTIAQEIHDKFQLSAEAINGSLTVENIDKGELKTELEAEASIEKGFSIVEANYKFPLNDTTGRAGIISGVHDRLSILSAADILKVLEIKDKTERKELQEAKKEEKREDKEVKKEVKEAQKEEKRENKEEQKNNKVTRNED